MEIDEQHNAALAKVAEMVGDARFAMLTTKEKDGTLRSRPMATMQLDSEGNLWFFTSLSSPKIEEAQPDQQVNLSYARTDKYDYLSISGSAELVHDKEKSRYYGLRGSSPGSQRAWTIRISFCSKSASWQWHIGIRPTVLLPGHTAL